MPLSVQNMNCEGQGPLAAIKSVTDSVAAVITKLYRHLLDSEGWAERHSPLSQLSV